MMENLTEAELIALNRLVVERIKLMRRAGKIVQMSNFAVGEKVSFQTTDGRSISGIISKLNQKTVSIITETGQWNVSPELLQKQ
jgi:hypothetical protein